MYADKLDTDRINESIKQVMEIVRRYDNPEYALNADRESDIYHGGIFVRRK